MIVDEEYIVNEVEKTDIIAINEACIKVKGILNGNIILNDKSNLILSGIMNGNIEINNESEALIKGTFNGNIVNKSKLKITGVIEGSIMNIDGGENIIEKNSIINGKRY